VNTASWLIVVSVGLAVIGGIAAVIGVRLSDRAEQRRRARRVDPVPPRSSSGDG
jgi:hypothetical protein